MPALPCVIAVLVALTQPSMKPIQKRREKLLSSMMKVRADDNKSLVCPQGA